MVRTAVVSIAKQFVVRADRNESDRVGIFVIENCAIIAAYIDAPAAYIFAMKRMIVENRIELVCQKNISAFFELLSCFQL